MDRILRVCGKSQMETYDSNYQLGWIYDQMAIYVDMILTSIHFYTNITNVLIFSDGKEDSSSKEPYKSFTESEDNRDWTKAKYECENRCWQKAIASNAESKELNWVLRS